MKQARGDARQIVIGIYQVLERNGSKDIVARARKGARAMGYVFSDRDCSEWLKPFQSSRARVLNKNCTKNARGFKHELHEIRTENAPESHSRVNNESLVAKEVDTSYQPPLLDATSEEEPKQKTKTRRVPPPSDLAAYAILKAVCPEVMAIIGKAMTQREWQQRNKKAALDLHAAGNTPEEVLAAWRRLTAYDGCRHVTLRSLQEAMMRDAVPKPLYAPRKPWERPDIYAALKQREMVNCG